MSPLLLDPICCTKHLPCLVQTESDMFLGVLQVFCSKKDPNCSACPMRDSCEYALNDGKQRKKQAASKDGVFCQLSLPCMTDPKMCV